MQLFKYCKSIHLDGFFRQGTLRIGTLEDYRSGEAHGRMIGDPNDGAFVLNQVFESLSVSDTQTLPYMKHLIDIQNVSDQSEVVIRNVVVKDFRVEFPNAYIFSASSEYSLAAQEQWRNDPDAQYDAAFTVHASRLFFRAISHQIRHRAILRFVGPVQYFDGDRGLRFTDPGAKLPPVFFKHAKTYSDQVEIRAVWEPIGDFPIEPFVIDVPDARRYCSAMSVGSMASRPGGSTDAPVA